MGENDGGRGGSQVSPRRRQPALPAKGQRQGPTHTGSAPALQQKSRTGEATEGQASVAQSGREIRRGVATLIGRCPCRCGRASGGEGGERFLQNGCNPPLSGCRCGVLQITRKNGRQDFSGGSGAKGNSRGEEEEDDDDDDASCCIGTACSLSPFSSGLLQPTPGPLRPCCNARSFLRRSSDSVRSRGITCTSPSLSVSAWRAQ